MFSWRASREAKILAAHCSSNRWTNRQITHWKRYSPWLVVISSMNGRVTDKKKRYSQVLIKSDKV